MLGATLCAREERPRRVHAEEKLLHGLRAGGLPNAADVAAACRRCLSLGVQVLVVHGVQTTLRSDRRYKHFQLLHQLLLKEFATLIPQARAPSRVG